jgi:hypothetical protein
MPALATAAERRLPRGRAHLALRFALWIGFSFAYQLARGLADEGGAERAFADGAWIIGFQRTLGSMFELGLQDAIERSAILIQALSLTYWLSQFAVVGLALIWVYLRAALTGIRGPRAELRSEATPVPPKVETSYVGG